ncbi:hypothetical protein K4K54_005312 [Colletotrichum sp. SAR 10_86]|nr:hypothetical protein K4K54_005312 [Colletotrichum sp. SAR 10_86]
MAMKTGEPLSSAAQKLMQLEDKYSVGGFAPTPRFLMSGKGSTLMDVDGEEITEFATMFSATNIGHVHPRLIEAVVDCMREVSGPEAADTASKIARKWGITHKKIPAEEVIVLGTSDNYDDLTWGIWPIMKPGNEAVGMDINVFMNMRN